ncbi:hypothetical protein BHM03_00019220 [Ensete ventricosum]|uniref:Uncharacterized protein n=1 Tax=Ensete ventricosum TaxID=4639 RepID=A0A445MFI5_ENSVE|nr:hypothetical protein BHM03_00019220 [Ensete ventricosum]
MELQLDNEPRSSLGIGPSSDDEVISRREFARRFAEGIGKLTENTKGDHREEDQRTYRKNARGYRIMWDRRQPPENLDDGGLPVRISRKVVPSTFRIPT